VEAGSCWCGARRWHQCFRTPRFGLVRCTSCGCYRIDPPPLQSDAESADFYTSFYRQVYAHEPPAGPHSARGPTSRFWRVVAQVPALRRTGTRAVDIGCGEGHLCAELRAAGWPSVIGVDVSRTRIRQARLLHPELEFRETQVTDASFGAASLDLIVMDNVIEHLPNPLQMLQRLRPSLGSDGHLVLITPNMRSGCFRLLGRRWTPELAPENHIFLFTGSALRRLLVTARFIVRATGSFHLPTYSCRDWLETVRSGAVKQFVWRGMQEAGGLYGRLIGAGPMLYVVASPDHAPHGSLA
jgi:2-polyprenyl-3-methyl-5-hydroxy-6-metoxy-1,4-benzoquinol methylase